MRTLTAQQTQVLASRFYNAGVRVLVDRGDGTMTDLTTLLGTNWVKTVKFGEDINDPCGTFTVTLLREKYFNSLSPGMTGSQANNLTGSYVPLLQAGRKIEIDCFVVPEDSPPGSGDWINCFQGYIDTVDPGKTDYEIELDGRDLGARVADRWAESSLIANPIGVPMETSMTNDVLTQIFAAGGGGAPALFTPTSPGWNLNTPYLMQPGQGCLDQLVQMAAQIGWDVRYYWDNGSSSFRLTLQVPIRASPTVLETFQPWQISDSQQLQGDISWVRNVVNVNYGLTSPPAGVIGGGAYLNPFGAIIATSTASITKYGRRFCAVGLGPVSNILDSGHATSLANAVLADLEDPLNIFEVDMMFRPEVQLMDYYTFKAPTPWWDVDQSCGVQAISHEFDLPGDDGRQGRAYTTLTCRAYPSTALFNWHLSFCGNGSTPWAKNSTPGVASVTSSGTIRGMNFRLAFTGGSGTVPNANECDWYESQLHNSTSNGFTPSAATLIERSRRDNLTA